MKLFIAVLALAALASAEYTVKTHDDLLNFRKECSTELSVPADYIEKFKKWDFPDDAVTHCYMKCIFQKFGIFDETAGFNVENIHQQLVGGGHADHGDETHAKIEKCADKNIEKSDSCSWAYRGGMCFIKDNLILVQESVKTH